ncbi:hypothetical protein AMECASPLE_005912 [Ameca splendens]|uniref:Secreted protein n=1 Tax=Ameca splendens TaxID=208324 RepID=A0ABV0YXE9_9TELE
MVSCSCLSLLIQLRLTGLLIAPLRIFNQSHHKHTFLLGSQGNDKWRKNNLHIHASVVNVCAGAEREKAAFTLCARREVTERNEGSSGGDGDSDRAGQVPPGCRGHTDGNHKRQNDSVELMWCHQ